MSRREFIGATNGVATWPFAARAQSAERVRRIGVLMHLEASDREGQDRLSAFLEGLRQLEWIEGRNMQIHTRWGANNTERRYCRATTLNARCTRDHSPL